MNDTVVERLREFANNKMGHNFISFECHEAQSLLAVLDGQQDSIKEDLYIMRYEVFPDKDFPSEWRVEAIDAKSGDIFVTVFGSADAEKRAKEYAAWKAASPEPSTAPASQQVVHPRIAFPLLISCPSCGAEAGSPCNSYSTLPHGSRIKMAKNLVPNLIPESTPDKAEEGVELPPLNISDEDYAKHSGSEYTPDHRRTLGYLMCLERQFREYKIAALTREKELQDSLRLQIAGAKALAERCFARESELAALRGKERDKETA